MAVKSGRNGSVKVSVSTTIDGATSTTAALGKIRSWSVDQSANTATYDSAAIGSYDTWVSTKTLSRSWSSTVSALFDDADAQQLALVVGHTIKVDVYPDGGDTATYYSGSGIITSLSMSASYDGMTEISFTVTGDGALTETSI